MPLELVRDVLDTQATDREGRRIGMVDGIVLELRDDRPPRIAYLELDATEAWCRLSPRLGRWARKMARPWRPAPQPYRVPWRSVLDVDIEVTLDVDAESTPAFALERWLREKILKWIPGSQ